MRQHGKKLHRRAGAWSADRPCSIEEVDPAFVQKVKCARSSTQFVELTLQLGVDPKHADQMVRGTVVLPHGLGKTKRVLAIAGGDKQKEAEEAGADIVGGEELVEKINGGWTDFDAVVATPDAMRAVGRLGRNCSARAVSCRTRRRHRHHRKSPRPSRKSRRARSSSASISSGIIHPPLSARRRLPATRSSPTPTRSSTASSRPSRRRSEGQISEEASLCRRRWVRASGSTRRTSTWR